MVTRTAFSDLRVWPEGMELPPLDVPKRTWAAVRNDDGVAYLVWVPEREDIEFSSLGSAGLPQGRAKAPATTARLPEDFYVYQLMDLDLTSEEEIACFATSFGCLELISILPSWSVPRFEELLQAIESGSRDADWRDPDALSPLAYDPSALRAHLATKRVPIRSVSLDEVRLATQLLRDMTRIVQADAGALPFDAVLAKWESPLTVVRPQTREDALLLLARVIDAGLRRVRPNVQLHGKPRAGEPGAPVTTFDAVCAQLFNKIASGTGFRTCGNTSCDQIFTHRRSVDGDPARARWSEETRGLRYCSPGCAQAQASRAYRARIRTAKGLLEQGRSISEIATRMKADPKQVEEWLATGARRRAPRRM
jgi:hypothetical protein